ncbi:MAG TPA: methyltransferase [Myxococcota bacterium]|nr:methyltransferase [Myxococcota bacterium]
MKKKAARSRSRRPPTRPQDAMIALISGYWISEMVLALTRLGVPDALGGRALAPREIAEKVGANAGYLHRVLRALATVGVCVEDARGRFKLTPVGATLRSGTRGSLRDFALMLIDDYNVRAWTSLTDALRSGRTAFELQFGVPIFEWLRTHPQQDREFSAAMASISSAANEAVARAYPFGRFANLVDVGGAHGHLLATILRRYKKLRGVLFDQPQVVAGAAASGFVSAPGVRERCQVMSGSFFESVPAGADAYLLKDVIHDWDDPKCARILGHCRDALAPGGRVLIVDRVIRPGNDPDWSKWLDVNMLVVPGGQERTEQEFRALLEKSGLRLLKVHPTESPLSLIEAELEAERR